MSEIKITKPSKKSTSLIKKFFFFGSFFTFFSVFALLAIPIILLADWQKISSNLGFSISSSQQEEYLKNFPNRGKSAFSTTDVTKPYNPFESTNPHSKEKWVISGYTNSLSPNFKDPRMGECPLGWETLPGVKELIESQAGVSNVEEACQWCEVNWNNGNPPDNYPSVCKIGCDYAGGPPVGGPYNGWPLADYELKGGHRVWTKLHTTDDVEVIDFDPEEVFPTGDFPPEEGPYIWAIDFSVDTTEQVETVGEIPAYSPLNGQVVEIGFDPNPISSGSGHGVFIRIQNTRQYDFWSRHGTGLAYIERACMVNWEVTLSGLTPGSIERAGIREGSLVIKGTKIGTLGQSAGSNNINDITLLFPFYKLNTTWAAPRRDTVVSMEVARYTAEPEKIPPSEGEAACGCWEN